MKVLYLAFASLFIFSCGKNDLHDETISGVVLHNVSLQPLPNQVVTVWVTSYLGLKKPTIEFPNGEPHYEYEVFNITTNSEGKFDLKVNVSSEWYYTAQLRRGEYEQKSPHRNLGFVLNQPGILQLIRETYDTIFAERPAYVRYQVRKRSTIYNNDTLFLSSYGENLHYPLFQGNYNWKITGIGALGNDQSFIDTLPGESQLQVPVKWLHKNNDTILYRQEYIHLTPQTVTDYIINF
jgi:hypothetical protein